MADVITISESVGPVPPARFLSLRAAGRSFAFVVVNAGAAVRTAGGWTIVLAALLAGCWLSWSETSDIRFLVGALLFLAALVGYPIASALIAVAWHRFVLRGERSPRLPFAIAPALRYLLVVAIAFVATVVAPSAAAGLALSNIAASEWSGSSILATAALGALTVLGVLLRFAFVLPALALGDDAMSLRRSWRETKHVWRGLLRGSLIVALPAVFALTVGVAALGYAPNDVTGIVLLLGVMALSFVFVMIYATFLSLAYQATVGSADRISEAFA